MSSGAPAEPKNSKQRQRELVKYVVLLVVITVVVVAFLLLAGPMSGNIFSNVVGSL